MTRLLKTQLGTVALFTVGIIAMPAGAQASILTTSNPTDIATFENGATVQTFDNISGITAAPITDYNPKDLTGSAALFNKDAAQPAFFNSGGASFNDPVGNPGVPIGIVSPTGGISGDKLSGNNVAGPIGVSTPPFTVFDSGAFMEVIFPTAVSKVGLYVAHGSLTLILKDKTTAISPRATHKAQLLPGSSSGLIAARPIFGA